MAFHHAGAVEQRSAEPTEEEDRLAEHDIRIERGRAFSGPAWGPVEWTG
jgi:hypothetical protein